MVAAEKFLEDAAGSETDATGGLYPSYVPMDEFVDVERLPVQAAQDARF